MRNSLTESERLKALTAVVLELRILEHRKLNGNAPELLETHLTKLSITGWSITLDTQ